MKDENKSYIEDIEKNIFAKNIPWNKLKNKTIYVTGATGLIGSLIVNTILYANKTYDLNCKIIAITRNKEKINMILNNLRQDNQNLRIVYEDICNEIIKDIPENIDYIVHTASQTSSKMFIEKPIQTINIALKGTQNTLELAKEKNVENFVFISTMEVYGRPQTDVKIHEAYGTDLLTNEVRNCYPISKLMCENLCTCYSKEYGFNSNVVRLTQTFGAGVSYDDNRIFAELAKCVIENKDIILHTKGETKRSYLYTSDAVNAILMIMLSNENSQVYNVANENTYCSILEMAELVAKKNKNIEVKCVIEENVEKYGYTPTLHMNLDTNKIKRLGWNPTIELSEMYDRLIEYFIYERNEIK